MGCSRPKHRRTWSNGPDIAAGARNAPGAAAITDLINTIGFYAIIACLVGLLLSGLILAIGPTDSGSTGPAPSARSASSPPSAVPS